MSKYIIELDDRIKLVTSVGVTENGVVYTTSDYVHNLEELNSDYINEHFGELQDEAYKQGYANAERIWRAPSSDNEFYQKGLEDAWKAARRIVEMTDPPYWEVFNEYKNDLFGKITASEAIEKLKAYEDKHSDRIEVGDIVERYIDGKLDSKGVYLEEDDGYWRCLFDTGATLMTFAYPKEQFKKTGKHCDIQSILEAIRA